MKLLIVLAAIALLIWLLKRDLPAAAQARKQAAAQPPRPAAPAQLQRPEEMVRCAACGLHLPASDALPAPGGRHYCCAEHRRQSPA